MPIIRDILLGAEKHGANLMAMCDELEIKPTDLYNSEISVPFDKAAKSWELALAQTGDPWLGLHLGEQTNPSIMGLVGHLMQNCRTLIDAFQSVCTNNVLVTDMFQYSIQSKGNALILTYKPSAMWVKLSEAGARQAVEQAMAGTINVFQLLSGKKIIPGKTTFSYPRQSNLPEYQRVFQSTIKFNESANALTFSKAQLATRVVSYDESLLNLFAKLIQQKSIQKKNKNGIEVDIRHEIFTTFKGQTPSLEVMASRLNMTSRSLQRRLEEHKLSYRQLASSIGREVSTALLKNKEIKVVEVARALGYTDARAFQRAFKSWTGKSPAAFRKILT
jgi:AraC-like DNA-binding protein